MVKVSDYVFQKIKELSVDTVFMLSGGGIMHLVDSLGSSGLSYVCCHHEQACAVAAQAYGMYRDALGVCLVTTGPGGTNALTGTAAAYMDSTPVLFLSGQVKRGDFASLRGVRQYGAQENNIVDMARPVTKYAVVVMEASDIRYELEKAIYLATTGRKGPVWVDIPLDLQSEMVEEDELRGYVPPQEVSEAYAVSAAAGTEHFLSALERAERPLILAGHGAAISGRQTILTDLAQNLQIPVMSTWRAWHLFDASDPLFFWSPGLQAPRYSNMILQTCDLLLVLGSRLDHLITAFNEERFALRAKKVIVDIDENEIDKLKTPEVTKVVADCGAFLEELGRRLPHSRAAGRDFSPWVARCAACRERFPLELERQVKPEGVDLYQVTLAVSGHCRKGDTIVVTSTSRSAIAGHMAFRHKKGQTVICSMGMGSMGFALPSAVGAWCADRKDRVIVFEGDGSLQLNLQEFQTIMHYGVPVKLFVFSNQGYAAISTMQERNFDARYVGCSAHSGLTMPDLEKIAQAYGLPYLQITHNGEIDAVVKTAMEMKGPVICNIMGSLGFDEIPKCISSVNEQGRRVSAALENAFPYLEPEVIARSCEALLGKAAPQA